MSTSFTNTHRTVVGDMCVPEKKKKKKSVFYVQHKNSKGHLGTKSSKFYTEFFYPLAETYFENDSSLKDLSHYFCLLLCGAMHSDMHPSMTISFQFLIHATFHSSCWYGSFTYRGLAARIQYVRSHFH